MNREEKKALFEKPGKSKRLWGLATVTLAIVGALAFWGLGEMGASGATRVTAEQGAVRIPQSELVDGQARFYTIRGADTDLRFFLVRSRDGVIRAAFDTCDVCYKEKKGYRQQGDAMVCNNCNQSFPTDMINVANGGCNPAPLQRELRDGLVLIDMAALEQGTGYFN